MTAKDVLRHQSANTNGYDVHICDETAKIIAEVKCNSPVGGAKGFGAAQEGQGESLCKRVCEIYGFAA